MKAMFHTNTLEGQKSASGKALYLTARLDGSGFRTKAVWFPVSQLKVGNPNECGWVTKSRVKTNNANAKQTFTAAQEAITDLDNKGEDWVWPFLLNLATQFSAILFRIWKVMVGLLVLHRLTLFGMHLKPVRRVIC